MGGRSRGPQAALSSLHQLPPQELIPGGPSIEGETGRAYTACGDGARQRFAVIGPGQVMGTDGSSLSGLAASSRESARKKPWRVRVGRQRMRLAFLLGPRQLGFGDWAPGARRLGPQHQTPCIAESCHGFEGASFPAPLNPGIRVPSVTEAFTGVAKML